MEVQALYFIERKDLCLTKSDIRPPYKIILHRKSEQQKVFLYNFFIAAIQSTVYSARIQSTKSFFALIVL